MAVDEQVITNDKRFTVAVTHHGSNPGSTLTIGLAKDEDAGQYICQLGSQDEGKIKHTVTIRGNLIIAGIFSFSAYAHVCLF